jgi:4'-phosphopantetheinyl transferase
VDRAVLTALFNPEPGSLPAAELILNRAEIRELHPMAERRRQSFLIGRWLAKIALQQLTSTDDLREIHVGSGVFGQPIVKIGSGAMSVSISHCETSGAAIAFPEEQPMGIDLEKIENVEQAQISTYISAAEHQLWKRAGLDASAGETLVWTAKEALSKVLRCGFTAPMEVLAVHSLTVLTPNSFELGFTNFSQYRCCALVEDGWVLSLVLPARTQISGIEQLRIR